MKIITEKDYLKNGKEKMKIKISKKKIKKNISKIPRYKMELAVSLKV